MSVSVCVFRERTENRADYESKRGTSGKQNNIYLLYLRMFDATLFGIGQFIRNRMLALAISRSQPSIWFGYTFGRKVFCCLLVHSCGGGTLLLMLVVMVLCFIRNFSPLFNFSLARNVRLISMVLTCMRGVCLLAMRFVVYSIA